MSPPQLLMHSKHLLQERCPGKDRSYEEKFSHMILHLVKDKRIAAHRSAA
jgi:hypothetical protein